MSRADYIRRARSSGPGVELFAHSHAIRTPEDNTFTMTIHANAYKSLLRRLLTSEMSLILGPIFTLLQYSPSLPFPKFPMLIVG